MKIILVGANGTIGELVQRALAGAGHEIVKVGRKSGDFRVEIENRESVGKLYQAVGSFDAVAIAAGEVAFAPLLELTAEKWQFSLGSKLMGQINLVQEAIPFIKEKDPSLWFRAYLTTNRYLPASRLLPSRARWKVLFGLPQLNFLGDCVSMW
jgi:NADP-dependent 3-hydroxy acid dehydrogenase YdfG